MCGVVFVSAELSAACVACLAGSKLLGMHTLQPGTPSTQLLHTSMHLQPQVLCAYLLCSIASLTRGTSSCRDAFGAPQGGAMYVRDHANVHMVTCSLLSNRAVSV